MGQQKRLATYERTDSTSSELLFRAGAGAGVFFCTAHRGKLLLEYSTSWYVYSVLKKVPEYQYPLYLSMGIRFKKLFLSIVFTILKKSYFWNIQPVPAPHVSRTKKIHQPSKYIKRPQQHADSKADFLKVYLE